MADKRLSIAVLALLLLPVAASSTYDDPVLGDSEAEVNVTVFASFQERYSKKFVLNVLPKIEENYVDDGKARVIWKDYPFDFDNGAKEAAIQMECLQQQDEDAFWEILDEVYQEQDSITEENVKDKIWEIAGDNGVDDSITQECRKVSVQDEARKAVEENIEEAEQRDFNGVPTTFIDDYKIEGAQPYSAFESVLKSKTDSEEYCNDIGISVESVSFKNDGGAYVNVENTGSTNANVQVTLFRGSLTVGNRTLLGVESGDIEPIRMPYERDPSKVIIQSTECKDITDEYVIFDAENISVDQTGTPPVPGSVEKSYDITLDYGWNMISVPFEVEASAFTEDCDIQPYKRRDGGKEFLAWTYKGADGWSAVSFSNDHLTPTRAYYINSGERCTVTVTGAEKELDILSIKKGWNMISADGSPADIAGTCEFQSYQGETVWQYNNGDWSHPANLSNKEGYFVYAENDCELGVDTG